MPYNERIRLNEVAPRLSSPPYVFICSSSFEKRCLSVANQVDPGLVSQAIICENVDMHDVIEKNDAFLRERFGDKAVHVPLRTDNPLQSADSIQKALAAYHSGDPKKFLVDITTFTHEGLLILLNLLRQHAKPKDTALFAYNPAGEYAAGMKQEEKWLSTGIAEIRSVLGYPGRLRPSRKCHLIVLVGYEVERAGMLIDAYEPAIISLGMGAPEESVNKDLYVLNRMFHERLKDRLKNVSEFHFSCVDPYAAMESIANQARAFEDHNVVLAPMNTKISSLGAAMAAFSDENIQMCYAQAQQYNFERYSIPGSDCILFDAEGVFKK